MSTLTRNEAKGRSPGRQKRSAARSGAFAQRVPVQAAQIALPMVERGHLSYECMDMEAYRADLIAAKGNVEQVGEDRAALWVQDQYATMKL